MAHGNAKRSYPGDEEQIPVRRDDPSVVEVEEVGGRRGGAPSRAVGGGAGSHRSKRARVMDFIDYEAEVDEDEDDDDGGDGGEDDDFIEERPDLGNESEQRMHGPTFIADESEEEVDEIERRVLERYARRHSHMDEDANEVEQQALLPILSDPKFWLVKCAIGHEREVAIRLMQRFIYRRQLRITSALALDHLKGYIYVEARTLTDVKEALAGLQNIFSSRDPEFVPLEEMTTVLSVENKTLEFIKGSFVRMRRGDYKGDLAQVVATDDVKREVTVRIVPRVDLRHLAEKSATKASGKVMRTETSAPPQKLFNKTEVRKYRNLTLCKKADRDLGDGFVLLRAPSMPELMFKDGFLYKKVSMKLVSTNYIQPTSGELDIFNGHRCDASGDVASLSTTFASRKQGYFVKGDAVVVISGDLKNLEGWVQKVEGDIVHLRPKITGLPETISFNEKELCKCFMPGEEIKVVSGVWEGASGMVVKMDGHVLSVLSHTTNQHISVFAYHAVRSAEFTKPIAQIGGFELNDLVKLNDNSFGVIIRLENERLEVFQGVPDQHKVRAVSLRDIKNKIYRRFDSKDRSNNIISSNDVVRVVDGPLKGKQGKVQHIYNGLLFIHHHHHTEHAGLICTRAHSCLLVGGLNYGNAGVGLQLGAPSPSLGLHIRGPPGGVACSQFSGWRFRACDQVKEDLPVGKRVQVKCGPYKGYRGRVVGLKNNTVRVELESIMKTSNFSRDQITDASGTAALAHREGRSLPGARTPIHSSMRPLMQTLMRDVGAIPMLGGMRTATGGSHGARNQR